MLRGAVLDVDGTVMRGGEPIPGAPEAVARLREAGLAVCFCTNNPTRAPAGYAEHLTAAGVDADTAEVITSGTATASYLREHHPTDDLFVVGEAGLLDQLDEAGLSVVADGDDADAVVVSIDRTFDYDDLCAAMWALGPDTPFVGTDPDLTIPTEERAVPGSGAIVNAVAGVAERDPDAVLGKPSAETRDLVSERLDAPAADCLVVGDRLDTDLALGASAGMTTVLVLTGVTSRADLEASDADPDYVLESVADIDRVLAAETGSD
ncbi:HAD-IIA family hydrolase [Candidatus Halobonum tyrrellensis]|uniref:HAD-superfamily hydrolase, subfamily IIA n=1 Tax=Candidatus Halobonum tyrrellensis G22 TaxID=1324957 RepID=V4HEN2_9EURY|nr:HAD-IIA family hydrolase [Candidatus Halobonum tyrrellensis]ESP89170.1 HAD-superfamily hydrolase, subfamily IIA [Candidatus Halobonum tyrrellensis G22]